MKITCLKIHHVQLPLVEPWTTSYGTENAIESILIKAYSEDSAAWVETCPLTAPLYSPETATTTFHTITRFFGPIVLGKELPDESEITKLLRKFRGNSFAKAGVEQCWWALESTRCGLPLHQLLGGESRKIEIGDGFGVQRSLDQLIRKIELSLSQGARRIKLKIRKGWDLDVIQAVRQTFPDIRLMVDCNGGYSLRDMDVFQKLDRFYLDMIEQPLHYRDLYEHSILQKTLETPICLDESVTCLRDAEQAVTLGSCRIINIKIGRVGGIFEATAIHTLCRENGILCWVGGMMESGLGAACNIEFATLENCQFPNDISVHGKFHTIDIVTPHVDPKSHGTLAPSEGAYIGKVVNEQLVDEITVQKVELTE